MALKDKGKNLLQDAVNYLKPFTSTTTSARWFNSWSDVPKGKLSTHHRNADHPVFVIFSYGTPIAWTFDEATWTIPGDKYSVTTTNHQNTVRTAIKQS